MLTPEIILLIFLPALLFEASYHLSFQHLSENFRFVSLLAIGGVILSAFLTAFLLVWWGGISWQTALLFGTMLAATDPISVVAIFRKLGVSPRLSSIIESESLFNDGTALVLFNVILGVVLTQRFNFWDSVLEFLRVSVGGLLLGIAIGYLALWVMQLFDDYLTEMLITLIVAYGTFLIAETISVSPALGVVAAGLLVGNFGQNRSISPESRLVLGYSWEFIGFLANSLIFLLVGLQIRNISFNQYWWVVSLAALVTLVGRGVVVVVLSRLTGLVDPKVNIPNSWQALLIWGGLRGALALAMALSLPITTEMLVDRDKILAMVFGAILFSLLVQGLTIEPFVKWLLKRKKPDKIMQFESLCHQLNSIEIMRQKVQTLLDRNLIIPTAARLMLDEYQEREKDYQAQLDKMPFSKKEQSEVTDYIRLKELLQEEKNSITTLFVQGLIDEQTLHELHNELNSGP
jgi:CPA1 family monovalent cation:H+ antiporter